MIRKIWHYLWEAWKFFVTFVVMPIGSYGWWADDIGTFWQYPMAVLVTLATIYLIKIWIEDFRG